VLGDGCIRTHFEIAKDAILAQFAAGIISKENLAQVGLRIGQREVFTLELRREPPYHFGAQA